MSCINSCHTGAGSPIIPLFNAWLGWSGAIPELFSNVDSYEQAFLRYCRWLCKLTEYCEMMGVQINTNAADIAELAKELADMKEDFADEFEDYFKARICEWLQENLACIVGNAVKFVQFGLTESGRLVAYIPSNWEFLQFYTILDGNSADFGKLAIEY